MFKYSRTLIIGINHDTYCSDDQITLFYFRTRETSIISKFSNSATLSRDTVYLRRDRLVGYICSIFIVTLAGGRSTAQGGVIRVSGASRSRGCPTAGSAWRGLPEARQPGERWSEARSSFERLFTRPAFILAYQQSWPQWVYVPCIFHPGLRPLLRQTSKLRCFARQSVESRTICSYTIPVLSIRRFGE